MKKFIAMCLIAVAAALFFGSCQLDRKAWVRFENLTDAELSYGVKFGDAMYIGAVPPGFISDYYPTKPGMYSLQAMNYSGQWITISTGALSASGGHYYTIIGTGSLGTYYWIVVQDS